MNKTKLVYFMTAILVIVGCYALNVSYSYFVQTETIDSVSSSVPVLSYSLGDTEETSEKIKIEPNSNKLINIKINNLGNISVKYVISLLESIEGVNVQLVDFDGNNILGMLSENSSKYVWFNVTNHNIEEKEITFTLFSTYYTLNLNEEDILKTTKIDVVNKYDITLNEQIYIKSLNSSLDKETNELNGSLLNMEDSYTLETGKNTYYFNGIVNDNYVNFANMCWRVVRILGNGDIKLVLEDVDNLCQESNGNFIIPLDESNNLYEGTYGYKINVNDQSIIDLFDSSVNPSMISAYKNFQLKFNDYLDYMNINDVCVPNNLYLDELGKEQAIDLDNNYRSWDKMYYKSYTNIKNEITDLKCDGNTITKYGDNSEIYVSGLSSEEARLSIFNNNTYLLNSFFEEFEETKGLDFWTLSPAYFDGLNSYAYVLNSLGELVAVDVKSETSYIRPTVIVKDTKLFDGIGEKSNPYTLVINDGIE